jgi:HSP20 family protein
VHQQGASPDCNPHSNSLPQAGQRLSLEISILDPKISWYAGSAPGTYSKGRKMANVTRYDPFGDLVDDFFRGFLVGPVGFTTEVPVRRLKIDVAEQNGEYKVLAELPGVKKEDIKVNIDGDEVSITAETRLEKESKDGERLLHSERYVGKVARAFRLAQEIDEARASAKYADGVLELTLPKKATAAAKQLTVQ